MYLFILPLPWFVRLAGLAVHGPRTSASPSMATVYACVLCRHRWVRERKRKYFRFGDMKYFRFGGAT